MMQDSSTTCAMTYASSTSSFSSLPVLLASDAILSTLILPVFPLVIILILVSIIIL